MKVGTVQRRQDEAFKHGLRNVRKGSVFKKSTRLRIGRILPLRINLFDNAVRIFTQILQMHVSIFAPRIVLCNLRKIRARIPAEPLRFLKLRLRQNRRHRIFIADEA